MNDKLWQEVIDLKEADTTSKGIANTLDEDDVSTIIATIEFFNATDTWLQQTYFDLKVPKYRVFDWLAMCIMGRNDDNRKQNEAGLKVLVHSFLKVKGDVRKWIQDLRETDYQVNTAWEIVNIEGD